MSVLLLTAYILNTTFFFHLFAFKETGLMYILRRKFLKLYILDYKILQGTTYLR